MKTHLVTMEVRHGDYHKVERGAGTSVEYVLGGILATPMGIGYGPKPGTDQYNELVSMLKLKGKHQWGWADYTLTIKG